MLVSVGEGVVDAGTVAMTVAVVPVGLGPLIGVQQYSHALSFHVVEWNVMGSLFAVGWYSVQAYSGPVRCRRRGA